MSKEVAKYIGPIIIAGIIVANIVDASAANTSIEEVQETIKYSTDTIYDDTLREGISKVEQEGADGQKLVTYSVTYKFGKEIHRTAQSEEIIIPATNKRIVKGTKKYYTCSDGNEYDNLNAKNECEKKISWVKNKDASLQECYADSNKFNCWYDEYPGTTLHWEEYTYNNNYNVRTGAICRDGWHSSATGRGACSHHGGVSYWLY